MLALSKIHPHHSEMPESLVPPISSVTTLEIRGSFVESLPMIRSGRRDFLESEPRFGARVVCVDGKFLTAMPLAQISCCATGYGPSEVAPPKRNIETRWNTVCRNGQTW